VDIISSDEDGGNAGFLLANVPETGCRRSDGFSYLEFGGF
jgi:hypothetical protein